MEAWKDERRSHVEGGVQGKVEGDWKPATRSKWVGGERDVDKKKRVKNDGGADEEEGGGGGGEIP